ncbi:MAG: hypothetical protein Ct9H300mP28_34920 [Pseudomonadota bacterium]|nr:MAG: hypothetical protein Ct9H300mP28_34920 [Pseudomonadota bacterium]
MWVTVVKTCSYCFRTDAGTPYYNSFFNTTHPPAIALAKKLSEVTPEGLNQVFFTNSGSESNDTVLRTARRFWRLGGQPEKRIFISRRESISRKYCCRCKFKWPKYYHEMDGLPIPDIEHIECPYWYKNGETFPKILWAKSSQGT